MRKSSRANLDAMLRHLASQHDPQDFPGTAYERQALLDIAGKRRLIEWHKETRRYELTPIGWRRLRRGGLGFASLAIGAGLGATIGAAALAMLWLPGDRSADKPAASMPKLAETAGAPAPRPPAAAPPAAVIPAALVRDADPSAPPNPPAARTVPDRPAEPARTAAPRPAEPARVAARPAEPAPVVDPPAEPARVVDRPAESAALTEQPVSPQPDGEAGTTAKEPAVKRSRHRSAYSHRRWHFGRGHYRDERYAGSGRLLR